MLNEGVWEFVRFFQEFTGLAAAGPVLGSCPRDTSFQRPRQSVALQFPDIFTLPEFEIFLIFLIQSVPDLLVRLVCQLIWNDSTAFPVAVGLNVSRANKLSY